MSDELPRTRRATSSRQDSAHTAAARVTTAASTSADGSGGLDTFAGRKATASPGNSSSNAGDDEHLPGGEHKMRKSCDYCVRMKRACDGKTPCELCTRRNKECTRSIKKKSGPAKGTKYAARRTRSQDEQGRTSRGAPGAGDGATSSCAGAGIARSSSTDDADTGTVGAAGAGQETAVSATTGRGIGAGVRGAFAGAGAPGVSAAELAMRHQQRSSDGGEGGGVGSAGGSARGGGGDRDVQNFMSNFSDVLQDPHMWTRQSPEDERVVDDLGPAMLRPTATGSQEVAPRVRARYGEANTHMTRSWDAPDDTGANTPTERAASTGLKSTGAASSGSSAGDNRFGSSAGFMLPPRPSPQAQDSTHATGEVGVDNQPHFFPRAMMRSQQQQQQQAQLSGGQNTSFGNVHSSGSLPASSLSGGSVGTGQPGLGSNLNLPPFGSHNWDPVPGGPRAARLTIPPASGTGAPGGAFMDEIGGGSAFPGTAGTGAEMVKEEEVPVFPSPQAPFSTPDNDPFSGSEGQRQQHDYHQQQLQLQQQWRRHQYVQGLQRQQQQRQPYHQQQQGWPWLQPLAGQRQEQQQASPLTLAPAASSPTSAQHLLQGQVHAGNPTWWNPQHAARYPLSLDAFAPNVANLAGGAAPAAGIAASSMASAATSSAPQRAMAGWGVPGEEQHIAIEPDATLDDAEIGSGYFGEFGGRSAGREHDEQR